MSEPADLVDREIAPVADDPAPKGVGVPATIRDGLEALVGELPALAETLAPILENPVAEESRTIQVLGTIKSGKSTLLGALIGRDLLPRGSGVTTHNVFHITEGASAAGQDDARVPADDADEDGSEGYAIRFHSSAALARRMANDLELVGVPGDVPVDLFARESCATLDVLAREVESKAQALADADASIRPDSLVPVAIARLRRTLAGLGMLHDDDQVREQVWERGVLRFPLPAPSGVSSTNPDAEVAAFAYWAGSEQAAALIERIDVDTTLPPGLRDYALMDSQGSDSLNPLDLAEVLALARSGGTILYVVQSRLGVRRADAELLRQLAPAAERVIVVLNVEAFSAMDEAAFGELESGIAADAAAALGAPPVVVPVMALCPLLDASGDEEQLQLIELLWRRESPELWDRLASGLDELPGLVAAGVETGRRVDAGVGELQLVSLANRLEDVLARDRNVVGVAVGDRTRAQTRIAIESLIERERANLKSLCRRAADDAFDARGDAALELDELLDATTHGYARGRPRPGTLDGTKGSDSFIDAALEVFNQDLTERRAQTRKAVLQALHSQFIERLIASGESVLNLVPEGNTSSAVQTAFGKSGKERRAGLMALYGHVRQPKPVDFPPVQLAGTARRALVARWYAGVAGKKVRRTLSRTDGAATPERLDAYWQQCLAAAVRAGREERPRAMSNARENYKFQYFYPVIDAFLDGLRERLGASFGRTHDHVDSVADSLLLSHGARDRVMSVLTDVRAYLAQMQNR